MRYRDDAGVPVLFVPKRSCGSHSTSGRLARLAQRAQLDFMHAAGTALEFLARNY